MSRLVNEANVNEITATGFHQMHNETDDAEGNGDPLKRLKSNMPAKGSAH